MIKNTQTQITTIITLKITAILLYKKNQSPKNSETWLNFEQSFFRVHFYSRNFTSDLNFQKTFCARRHFENFAKFVPSFIVYFKEI